MFIARFFRYEVCPVAAQRQFLSKGQRQFGMAIGTFVVAFAVFNSLAVATRGTVFEKVLSGGFFARNG